MCYVRKQTEEICLEAVRQNGISYIYVENPTIAINRTAVKQLGVDIDCTEDVSAYILDFSAEFTMLGIAKVDEMEILKNQSLEACLTLVKKRPEFLQFIQNQTEQICLAAVRVDGRCLQYVRHQTDKICLTAVKCNCEALKYVEHQTRDICLVAIKIYGLALKYVANQTEEICLEAIKSDLGKNCICSAYEILNYVCSDFREVCLKYLDGFRLSSVNKIGVALRHIENQTPEICLAAVKKDKFVLQFVQEEFREICKNALNGSRKKRNNKAMDLF